MGKSVETLIFSKSLALIEKTRRRVAQVDANEFPTASSKTAREILLRCLSALADQANWPPMNAETLYNTLIRLQALVEEVEASTSSHISWPLVSYCDLLWQQLFPTNNRSIFYSVTNAHNYTISSFTGRLRHFLKNVLSQDQINTVCGTSELYCLQLASLEDENLPLYANIGHEFGHALYWSLETDIKKILSDEVSAVFRQIHTALTPGVATVTNRDATRVAHIIQCLAMELFCDLAGAKLIGPAFLLSLHEMSWGANLSHWAIRLPPEGRGASYPSFRFRVDCLKEWIDAATFVSSAAKAFKLSVTNEALQNIGQHIADIPSDHTKDQIAVTPDHDSYADNYRKAFESHLPQLKVALKKFLVRCVVEIIQPRLTNPEFVAPSPEVIGQLLHRLESDILPNLVPNATLLGQSVSLTSMLNAAALYRVHLLQQHEQTKEVELIYRDVQKVERLTAKALEVSYIQKEFQRWEKEQAKP